MAFTKKEQAIISIRMTLNLYTITEWIKGGANDDEKISDDHKADDCSKGDIRSNTIDIIPRTQDIDSFFHRSEGKFSNSFDGMDELEKRSDDELIDFYKKEFDLDQIEWMLKNGSIVLFLDENCILIVPLDDAIALKNGESVSNSDDVRDFTPRKISVPVSRSESEEVWRHAYGKGVSYHNSLATINIYVS